MLKCKQPYNSNKGLQLKWIIKIFLFILKIHDLKKKCSIEHLKWIFLYSLYFFFSVRINLRFYVFPHLYFSSLKKHSFSGNMTSSLTKVWFKVGSVHILFLIHSFDTQLLQFPLSNLKMLDASF